MARNLRNKVVVITGGADGIGFKIAETYLEKGAKVTILLDIAEEQGLKAEAGLCTKHGENRAKFIKCDITADLEAVTNKIIDTYKTVGIVVNSAGKLNERLYKETIDLNVKSLVDCSLRFWEHMRTDKGGKGGTIINISSISGFRVNPYFPTYHASKFAVLGFTKSLGHHYNFNRSGVRVVALCPGYTHTNLIEVAETWDFNSIGKDYIAFTKEQLWQDVDSVGKAAVEVFENADSGTVWLIEGAQPIVQV